ncbi:hypothetical protein BE20_21090 [Sorangium cellulosum]|nr:hypothetical protein BE20_21090 [Sorangium cellulosum]
MLGLRTRPLAFASLKKRWSATASSATSGRITLSATSRSMSSFFAAHTDPLAPRPRSFTSR